MGSVSLLPSYMTNSPLDLDLKKSLPSRIRPSPEQSARDTSWASPHEPCLRQVSLSLTLNSLLVSPMVTSWASPHGPCLRQVSPSLTSNSLPVKLTKVPAWTSTWGNLPVEDSSKSGDSQHYMTFFGHSSPHET